MRGLRLLSLGVLCGALVSATGCHPKSAPPKPSTQDGHYKLHGKVVDVDAAQQSLVVSHQAIPGFMGAMTMAYKVKDPAVLTEVHAGDIIFAALTVPESGEAYLEQVVVTGQARPDPRPATEYHAPAPGDAVPDFALLDQSDRKLRIADFRGKVLLVTFIYTRCPLSDYCPRMSRNFAQVDRALAADPAEYAKTHLLSISFDPKYDTPNVLKSYGEAYTGRYTREDFSHWTFAAPNQKNLTPLEQWFGVGVTPGENNTLQHSLSTCVIGKDGKVVAWYPTNDWTVQQVLSDVRKALAA